VKITASLDVTHCSLVDGYQYFLGTVYTEAEAGGMFLWNCTHLSHHMDFIS